MENWEYLLIPFVNLDLLLLVAVGTVAGIFIGAIPGLSVTLATALLLSLTYSWDLLPAIVLMLGVYFGGVYGGSRAAILVNIPGGPSSLATSFDGYPMAQRGEAGLAIGLTTIASVIGGIVGVIVLATAAPFVASFAIQFAPRDYFLLATLGLLLVGSLSKGSMSKGIFAAGIGVIIGLVGMDPVTGSGRFTFGQLQLMGGINFIIALLGLFGLSEVLYQIKKLKDEGKMINVISKIIPPFRLLFNLLPLSLRVSVIGVLTGALPGVGGEIAALLSYDHAKRSTKNPSRPFGKGAYEGAVAPEAGNSAAIGGAMIPMLTLGIPGDAVTAIIIGALFIHGLRPGPMLMTETPDLFWVMVGSSFLANIFILIFGLALVSIFVKIVTIPKQLLLPIIVVITVIGSYAINHNIIDVYWMFAFGILGLLMKVYKFPVGPMVLGIILGPVIDISFRRAVISERGDIVQLIKTIFTQPISLVLALLIIFMLVSNTPLFKKLIGNLTAKFRRKKKTA
ncbi:tripartite tricarboxylate transporter permease [Bacillus horti]|uniref:Tricarboxylic transport membrane protein n=1 Tax=Caldalkalibacillus horti TaxID=77523 RepID=A0ABT9W167_9BACI|nr:tripartite tricarboxylate transporter permease [Bacillus horti]MDQ0166990.1 putative tricarboxylic transport membrane protein [Bacillus horti]